MPSPSCALEPSCNACGSRATALWGSAADPEYRTGETTYDYHVCQECRSLSIAPCPEDRLEEIYPKTYYSYAAAGASLLERAKQGLDRRLFKSLLGKVEGEDLSALDIGGGSGWLLNEARAVEPRLKRTVVVDIDAAAEPAARAAGHDFVLSRIEDFSYARRFHLIAMLNLIEHVRTPGPILAKVAGLLADDGRLLVKTPNCDSLDARLFRASYWGGLHSPRHFVLFTPESFRRLAADAGLKVERLSLTQGAPFWAASVLAALDRRGLVEISADRPMYRHPLFKPLLAAFAALDFARRPFMRTSQMFVVLKRA